MGKLRLQLDQLTVDSFDTSTPEADRGTVFGEQCTCHTNCTCPGCPTCDHTQCGQLSCHDSCAGTCQGWYTCQGANTRDQTCNMSDNPAYMCCPW